MKIKFFKLLFFLTCIILLSLSCQKQDKESTISGTFQGTADSLFGKISVEVFIEKNKIEHISILEYADTPSYSEPVFSYLPKKIVEANSTDVDVVSGATITGEAFLKAIRNALQKAGLNQR